jgi:hypothetical protein
VPGKAQAGMAPMRARRAYPATMQSAKVAGMRRFAFIALITLAVLAAAWSAFWIYAAGDIETRLAAWAEAQRAQGLVAEYTGVSVSGFPLSWHIHVTGPVMTGAGPTRWEWRGEAVTAEIRPWALRNVPATFPGLHHVAGGAGGVAETFAIRAARPHGRIALAPDGRLANLRLDLEDARIQRLPDPTVAAARQVRLSLSPHRAPQPTYRTDTLDLALQIEGLTVPEPPRYALGNLLGAAQLDASFKGALPPGSLADSVASWRDSGGVIEVNRLALRWGPLEADGEGTLALDSANRPLGAMTARIRGYTETVDALAAAGVMRPRDAGTLKIALNLVARRSGSGGPGELNVPITAQDGRLNVAGFSLLALPPLMFR